MKKLAARDFEDILQVGYSIFLSSLGVLMYNVTEHNARCGRTTSRASQYKALNSALSSGRMARPRKTKNAHRNYITGLGKVYEDHRAGSTIVPR